MQVTGGSPARFLEDPQRAGRARGPPTLFPMETKPQQETPQGSLKAGSPDGRVGRHQGRLCPLCFSGMSFPGRGQGTWENQVSPGLRVAEEPRE